MNENNWYKEQAERDRALMEHWREHKRNCERGIEAADRQIAYLGSLMTQRSLEELGMEYYPPIEEYGNIELGRE